MLYIPSTGKTAICPYCEKEIRNVHGEFAVHFIGKGFKPTCCQGSLEKIK